LNATRANRARVKALVRLLDDGSPTVLDAVSRELATAGRVASAALRQAANDANPVLRSRARAVQEDRRRADVLRRLVGFCGKEPMDLESGLFVLSSLDREGFDARPYRKALDAMAVGVRAMAAAKAEPLDRAMALVHYMAGERGFAGDEQNYHRPDNVFLHRAIERRTGLPLTLTCLYLLVARRAGIKAEALALPGHVLLRINDGTSKFVVDPFHSGRLRTKEECMELIASHGLTPSSGWFKGAGDHVLLQRQALNLAAAWRSRGMTRASSMLLATARRIRRPALTIPRTTPAARA